MIHYSSDDKIISAKPVEGNHRLDEFSSVCQIAAPMHVSASPLSRVERRRTEIPANGKPLLDWAFENEAISDSESNTETREFHENIELHLCQYEFDERMTAYETKFSTPIVLWMMC
jgi:hypothetical protein